MFYRKNLFAWEQVLRIVVGLAMVGALFYLPGWLGYLIAAGGGMLAITGVFGYCPACAMIGRKPVDRT